MQISNDFSYTKNEFEAAKSYLLQLQEKGISYSFPGDINYPRQFKKMIEPPLFFEFKGSPIWKNFPLISIVGSRHLHELSRLWMQKELSLFLLRCPFRIVSGGALGVDFLSHIISISAGFETIAILPSGIDNIYLNDLKKIESQLIESGGCLFSEFESEMPVHKSHFFHRNRIIAAFGLVTTVIQASLKSGTMLTVHHALQNGKPVVVVPSHPSIHSFNGNLKLLSDGAIPVYDHENLEQIASSELLIDA